MGKIENVSFPEAVRIVALKCGIPLPKREYLVAGGSGGGAAAAASCWICTRRRRRCLRSSCAAPEGALAREYLAGRGLTPEGIKAFRIGYAPDSFNALRDRLSGMADAETLRACGLFSSKEQGDGTPGPLYDRFRKRVMFPICERERAGDRVYGADAGDGREGRAEVHQFAGDAALFEGPGAVQPGQGERPIRQAGFALLVEGQMDCISVFLRGIQNVIATSGTAFTEQQVALLRRHTSNVVVNFDPDAAGANAAEKSIALLTEEGFTIKIVTLEGGLDPDRLYPRAGRGGVYRRRFAGRGGSRTT